MGSGCSAQRAEASGSAPARKHASLKEAPPLAKVTADAGAHWFLQPTHAIDPAQAEATSRAMSEELRDELIGVVKATGKTLHAITLGEMDGGVVVASQTMLNKDPAVYIGEEGSGEDRWRAFVPFVASKVPWEELYGVDVSELGLVLGHLGLSSQTRGFGLSLTSFLHTDARMTLAVAVADTKTCYRLRCKFEDLRKGTEMLRDVFNVAVGVKLESVDSGVVRDMMEELDKISNFEGVAGGSELTSQVLTSEGGECPWLEVFDLTWHLRGGMGVDELKRACVAVKVEEASRLLPVSELPFMDHADVKAEEQSLAVYLVRVYNLLTVDVMGEQPPSSLVLDDEWFDRHELRSVIPRERVRSLLRGTVPFTGFSVRGKQPFLVLPIVHDAVDLGGEEDSGPRFILPPQSVDSTKMNWASVFKMSEAQEKELAVLLGVYGAVEDKAAAWLAVFLLADGRFRYAFRRATDAQQLVSHADFSTLREAADTMPSPINMLLGIAPRTGVESDETKAAPVLFNKSGRLPVHAQMRSIPCSESDWLRSMDIDITPLLIKPDTSTLEDVLKAARKVSPDERRTIMELADKLYSNKLSKLDL